MNFEDLNSYFGRMAIPSLPLLVTVFLSHIAMAFSDGISRADVASLALTYTGFGQYRNFNQDRDMTIDTVTMENNQTPFLHQLINGRKAWRISFNNIDPFGREFSTEGNSSLINSFDVFIDREKGVLFKIVGKAPVVDNNVAPEPDAERAEGQMKSTETFTDFVETVPKLCFADILAKSLYFTPQAKEVSAILVMASFKGYDAYVTPKPFWMLTLRGIGPIPTHGPRNAPEIPLYQRNFIREVFDAESGHLIFWTTVPTVKMRTEDSLLMEEHLKEETERKGN